MDLRSVRLALCLVLYGLSTVCFTEDGVVDINSTKSTEIEVYDAPELDDPSSTPGTLPSKDVFVVSSDTSPNFVTFVNNAINAVLNVSGEVTYKEPGGDFEQIKSPNTYDHKLAMANAQSGPITNDIIAVMAKGDARYNIFVLVESGADPIRNIPDMMMALIHQTRTRINFLIMDQGSRGKRAISVSSIYQQVAAASGGMVITATKYNIGQVANIIKQSIKTNTVDIMRFDFDKPGGQNFQIPVDDTMTQLTVQIQTRSALPVAMITSGSGLPVSPKNSATSLGSKVMLYEFNITKPTDYGQWIYTKLAGGDWDVKVTGQSQVDFTYAFMEPGPGGLGSYPIKGRPIAGKQYLIRLTVPQYDNLKAVAAAMLLDNHNTPIGVHGVVPLHNVGGRRGKSIFTGNVTTPTVNFRVALEAVDKRMHQARRLDPYLVIPISIKLIIHPAGVTKILMNQSIDIEISVVNEASQKQDILVRIEDDLGFAQSPVNLFYNDVKSNEMRNGTFRIQAGSITGITDTVTITAKPYVKGQQTQGQFAIQRFTVVDKDKKLSTSTTLSTTTTKLTTTLMSTVAPTSRTLPPSSAKHPLSTILNTKYHYTTPNQLTLSKQATLNQTTGIKQPTTQRTVTTPNQFTSTKRTILPTTPSSARPSKKAKHAFPGDNLNIEEHVPDVETGMAVELDIPFARHDSNTTEKRSWLHLLMKMFADLKN